MFHTQEKKQEKNNFKIGKKKKESIFEMINSRKESTPSSNRQRFKRCPFFYY
jgi:hypothetical protein